MAYLGGIAQGLIAEKLLATASVLGGTSKAARALGAVAGIFGVAGLSFMVYAAHLWLAHVFPPDLAAALTGCLSFLIASVCAFIAGVALKRRRKTIKNAFADMDSAIREIWEAADDHIAGPVKDNPVTAVTVAGLAGYLCGRRLG